MDIEEAQSIIKVMEVPCIIAGELEDTIMVIMADRDTAKKLVNCIEGQVICTVIVYSWLEFRMSRLLEQVRSILELVQVRSLACLLVVKIVLGHHDRVDEVEYH